MSIVKCLACVAPLIVFAAWLPQRSAEKPPVVADERPLSMDEFWTMPKVDAHAHVMALESGQRERFAAFLAGHNISWLDICTNGLEWESLQRKVEIARNLHRDYQERIAWATSFNLSNWGSGEWLKQTLEYLDRGFSGGAVAVKVWKEIGMVLKDPGGRFVMIDDPRLEPVLDYIQRQGRTLTTHLGEPRNCWLPLASMTTDSDRRYFTNNPQYHAYLHPEIPGYREQIAARDRMLERHPGLRVVGCHLGSLEFDVDELARRLDRYPNFSVDLAARLVHLQIQPREKVRSFLIKYQDRILYGTDLELSGEKGDTPAEFAARLARIESVYRLEATWLATDETVDVPRASPSFRSRGLSLPAAVVRKLYYENARRCYPKP